ncbi:E3 SUMO-protein ligase PIAS2 isoform X2 [Neocloeon triangulifer]|uniref:E3 SUMO-protein ligase PIAS2 isoform X2 n=1 Tax=Neocloeon triangulifer TaxID=2078957 RepID=UPI00286F1DB8|nr:E3 SUMO-protein ligase PIAS2 isoform X2 [Neocloeon triangulifer]
MQLRARSYVEYFPSEVSGEAKQVVTSRNPPPAQAEEEMADVPDLKSMILSFRVSELQTLLQHAGKNRSGRKCDLQHRALDLLKSRNVSHYQKKIKELYRSIQNSNLTLSGAEANPPEPNMRHNQYGQPSGYAPQQMSSSARRLPASDDEQLFQATSPTTSYSSLNAMLQSRTHPPPPPPTNPMASHMGHYPAYPSRSTMMPAGSGRFPVHPDVKLKKLPFYDLICELVKPSTLMPSNAAARLHESNFTFHLTPQQATEIAMSFNNIGKGEYTIQVQLRFSLLETSTEQDDCFPPGISVKVNNKILTLPNPIPSNKPGVEPKRPPRPNNITPLLKLSPTVGNTVNVSWAHDYTRNFVVGIYLVKKLSSTDLLNRLKNKGVRPAEYSRGLIKEKLQEDADCEIATTSLRVSLMCPLGKMRMSVPCRPSTCVHLQCFDASLFIQMNERKPTWNCPVCDKHALYDTLVIDGYFQDVLLSSRLPADCNEIQLTSDGSWTIISTKKESNAQSLSPKREAAAAPAAKVENVETLSDEAVLEDQPPKKKPAPVMVDLTLSDSEDESPPKKMHNRIQAPESSSSSSNSSFDSNTRPTSPSSVGRQSPSVITLDSPSPPPSNPFTQPSSTTGHLDPPPAHSNNFMQMYYNSMSTAPSLPILDLDSDSSGSHTSRNQNYN